MKKKEVKKLFSMTFAALEQLGDKAVRLITRDLNELIAYGISEDTIKSISEKTKAFKDMPTDEEYEGAVSDATEVKDAAADAVKVAVRSIMVRVGGVFEETSGKYREFGTKGMDELKDDDLVRCAKRVVRKSTKYLDVLKIKGLTQAIIDDLAKKAETFDDAIDAKDDAVGDRDIATEERIEAANALYKEIAEVFESGKNYWVDKNEAKYNDYVIYDDMGIKEEGVPSSQPPTPPEEPK